MKVYKKLYTTLSSFRPKSLLWILLLLIVFIVSFLVSTYNLYLRTLIEIPAYGGRITELVVGVPRFINPVLAESQVDRDLTSLVYSGLMKKDADGTYTTDLASDYTVSEDGLVYTFTLSDGATFHDGSTLTSADVVYTVNLVQNPSIKSPLAVKWEGVKAEEVDEKTIRFTLKKEYVDFISVTDIGVLPKNIWKDLSPETFTLSDYNQKGVGSGPYIIDSIQKDKGIPSEYGLTSFKKFSTGSAYIQDLRIVFVKDEDEAIEKLKNNDFTSVAILDPSKASVFRGSEKLNTVQKTLPRIYALYFNQGKNQNLVDQNVRSAVQSAIDKKRIVTESVYGFAEIACSPVPKVLFETDCKDTFDTKAVALSLESAGYTKNSAGYFAKKDVELALHITSVRNAPEIERAAEIIRQNLEAVGVRTTVTALDISDINQRVIKERDYEVLIYGSQTKKPADLYAYWHSSQKSYPGLNLSLYANTNVDTALESLRKKSTEEDRESYYRNLNLEIQKDIPAVFLFSPSIAYIYDKKIHLEDSGDILEVSDRLSQITSWYTQTEYVWSGLQNVMWLKKIRNIIY